MSDLTEETSILCSVKTKFPPCSLQLNQNADMIFVGTYELEKPTGLRYGTIERYNIERDNNSNEYKLCLMEEVENTIDDENNKMSAILDLKIIRQFETDQEIPFITCHSTGCLKFWSFNKANNKIDFKENIIVNEDDSILITSLHIKETKNNDMLSILCTSTDGSSAIITVNNSNGENTIEYVGEMHELECWTGEFGNNPLLDNCFFTGGDDSALKLFDTRQSLDTSVWSNNRIHEAGVVAIKTNNNKSFNVGNLNTILTGSYDDNIRLFDLRMLGPDIYPGKMPPLGIKNKNLEGGVWRLIDTDIEDELLVCCMYNGAKTVKIDYKNEDSTFTETNYVKNGHNSMCYGGDFRNGLIATCSFYDNSLQIWIKK
ncbi:hypothetical protein ACO0SA_001090 [Hanseniaspora valbyensis]